MRDSIENISQLQKKLNDLQLEHQILKNILDKAGLSYHKELSKLRQSGSKASRRIGGEPIGQADIKRLHRCLRSG